MRKAEFEIAIASTDRPRGAEARVHFSDGLRPARAQRWSLEPTLGHLPELGYPEDLYRVRWMDLGLEVPAVTARATEPGRLRERLARPAPCGSGQHALIEGLRRETNQA